MIPYSLPPIDWWIQALRHDVDVALHRHVIFRKMTYMNRYEIGAANGRLLLSIPLVGGRNQRKPLSEVKISYQEDWQKQHWRSLASAYRNTPYFEYFEDAFKPFYHEPIESLLAWNEGMIMLVNKLMRLDLTFKDSNGLLPSLQSGHADSYDYIPYHQPFEHKHGFLANLSILDLLLCEGVYSKDYLLVNDQNKKK